MSNPAYTRVAAYHWYLGSAFWREPPPGKLALERIGRLAVPRLS
jgi:hypothetical protein